MFQFFRHPVLLGALINAVNAKITLDETSIEDFDKITSLADETLYFEVFKEKYDRNSFNLQITPYLNEFERFFVASKVMEYLKIEPFVSGEKWISLPTIDVLKISQKMNAALLQEVETGFKQKHNLEVTIDIENPFMKIFPGLKYIGL